MKYNHFLQYLKEMKILKRFQDNLHKSRGANLLEYYQIFKGKNYSNLISAAFAWGETPEGSGFWCDIDSNFTRFYFDYRGD